jgi:hypothetical protein
MTVEDKGRIRHPAYQLISAKGHNDGLKRYFSPQSWNTFDSGKNESANIKHPIPISTRFPHGTT